MNLIKFLSIIFCLSFVTNSSSQVTVQTSNLKVNGVVTTSNTINFNSSASVSVSLDVNLTTLNGTSNNLFGNLFLYFKPINTENEVLVGFTSVTFVVNNPPFVTATNYTSMNSFSSVVLSASNFFATGGVFYAKYINNNNVNYLSTNISVIGGTRTSTNPPTSQSNSICCNQTIRKGDKPSSISGSMLNTAGVNVSWIKGSNTYVANYSTVNNNNNFVSDYLTENTSFKRRISSSSNITTDSNFITVTVVPNPIISNTITADASLIEEGVYELSDTEQIQFSGFSSQVNLNVLSNPFHTVLRSDPYVSVSDYQWQYKSPISDAKWTNITNATTSFLSGFSLSNLGNNNSNNFYLIRRIAKYQTISLVSNVLKVIVRKSSISNTICCNQTLSAISSGYTSPSLIVGSVPVFSATDSGNSSDLRSSSFIYQWQTRTRSNPWTNIVGANSKDYLPPNINYSGTTISYRRVVIFNVTYWAGYFGDTGVQNYYEATYTTYSNTITISTPRIRSARISSEESIKDNYITNSEIVIYPNPAFSILNISNKNDFTNTNVKIFNTLGQEIKLDFINLDKNSMSVDVSSLNTGLYYLHFEKKSEVIVEKFIKK